MRMAEVDGWMEADGMTDGRLPVARRDHLLIEKRRRPPASNATTMLKSKFRSVLVVMSRSRERGWWMRREPDVVVESIDRVQANERNRRD